MFGHADGMVRAIGDEYLLLNNYIDIDKSLRKRIISALEWRFYVEELHYDRPRPSPLSWAYLNFLHVNSCIFVPGLGLKEDYAALEQIQKHYPHHKVVLVPGCQDLAKEGGALNCITWNILTDREAQPQQEA